MRNLFLLLLLSATVISCTKSYTITGKVKGVKDGTEVVLQRQDSTGVVKVDTVKVAGGQFEFKGEPGEQPVMHFVTIKDINGGFPVIVESGDITVAVDKDSIFKSKLSGTDNNEDLTDYMTKEIAFQRKTIAFGKSSMEKIRQAQTAKDTAGMRKLQMEQMGMREKFQKEYEAISYQHIEKHPKSFVSLILLTQYLNSRTPDMDRIGKLFEKLDADLKTTKEGKKLQSAMDNYKKTAVGAKAPDFTAPDASGKKVSLNSALGKVTLLDFWASWCKPCRQESPNMVALYNEFHAKGLNIIGFSLDAEKAAWSKAVAEDHMTWTQLSNLKAWDDPVARTYDIRQIPTTFILDAQGKIVAKNLSGAELRAKVAALLGS